MSRKNMFKNLPMPGSLDEESPQNTDPSPALSFSLLGLSGDDGPKPRGVVGALSQVIDENSARSKRAEERAEIVEQQLAAGQAIIEIDPSLIDPSFVRDRMSTDDFPVNLCDAIRDHGQQVPILVRPHPEKPGRYQAAYGHRRLQAVAHLKLKVRAVVREMTDEQLIIAQGQENNERSNLSFIEKCRFAAALEQKSFKRNTITAALGVNKSHLSEMLAIVDKISPAIIDAIGPAPKAGRRTWMELSARLASGAAAPRILKAVSSPEFATLATDERLRRILMKPRSVPQGRKTEKWSTAQGAALAKIRYDADTVSITISRSPDPEFADQAIAQLKLLYERKRSENSNKAA